MRNRLSSLAILFLLFITPFAAFAASLFELTDLNNDGEPDWIRVGEDTNGNGAVLFLDVSDGTVIKKLNIPAWFDAYFGLAEGNQMFLFGRKVDNKYAVLTYDLTTRLITSTFSPPSWFNWPVFPADLNDSAAEIDFAVMGSDRTFFFDATTYGQLDAFIYQPAWLSHVGWQPMVDYDNDGVSDLILYSLTPDFTKTVTQVVDAVTKAEKLRIVSTSLDPFQVAFSAYADANGDGYDEFILQSYSPRNIVTIANGRDGRPISRFYFPSWLDPQLVHFGDILGDSTNEMLMVGDAGGASVLSVYQPFTKQLLWQKKLPSWITAVTSSGVEDFIGSSKDEIFLEVTKSDNKTALLLLDGANGNILSGVNMPSWFIPN